VRLIETTDVLLFMYVRHQRAKNRDRRMYFPRAGQALASIVPMHTPSAVEIELDLPQHLRTRAKTNSSMLRIGGSTDVRNDAICKDLSLPHLDFLADNKKWGN